MASPSMNQDQGKQVIDNTNNINSNLNLNKMDLLLFKLIGDEVFGINVLKVREVTQNFCITRTPKQPKGVVGTSSLRGQLIPVISLASFLNINHDAPQDLKAMMVTEFNGMTQGFLVREIDKIVSVDWSEIRSPKGVIPGESSLVTGITEIHNESIITILDVEAIMSISLGDIVVPNLTPVPETDRKKFALVADDSALARRKISEVLVSMNVDFRMATTGKDALNQLNELFQKAEKEKKNVNEMVDIIMTDAEMPEMDGFAFTKFVKTDPRFKDIPVIMHSSLSKTTNQTLISAVGVDSYVPKFVPELLADAIRPYLLKSYC